MFADLVRQETRFKAESLFSADRQFYERHGTFPGDRRLFVARLERRLLLAKYLAFNSKDPAELENLLRTVAAGEVRTARLIEGGDGFRCNAVQSDIMPIFYLESDFDATFDFQPVDYIRLVFQTHGASKVIIEGDELEIDSRHASYILPDGKSVTEVHPTGYRSLAVRIQPTELKERLAALCGVDISGQIVFQQPGEADHRFLDFVRRPLFAAARELDASDASFHSNLLAELKAITLTRLLLFAPHNFSALIEAQSTALGRSQMSKAEDYIAANWDKAIDVSELAAAVGVSARTILRYFREKHGETPRDFIRRARLERARQMLLARGDETTVVGVALRCGFSSLGHFAESYRRRFGELPSETLRDRS